MSDTAERLHPASAVTPEDRVRQAKLTKRKAQFGLERAANQPMLAALDPKRGGASLPMFPDRLNRKGNTTITANMSYITAHKMDMSLLKVHLDWLDILAGSASRSCNKEEQNTEPHKAVVALYQKLVNAEIHLPRSIRVDHQTDRAGSTEEENENVLRRQCNEVYFQYIEKAIQGQPKKSTMIFWDSDKPEGAEWSFGNEVSSLINENALLSLFIQRPITQKTSEMELERLVGNFFMQILQGSSREMETKMSSGTEVRYFMPFSAFGIRPRPDCIIQVRTDHPLLMPISFIAEAKASDNVNGEFGPVAQIAGVVHSTLAFLVFTWHLRYPNLPLPSEAVLPGVAYSSGLVHIYAFYPFIDYTTPGHTKWGFRGLVLYTSEKALAQMSLYERALLMSQMLLIQNVAYKFGNRMKTLIGETYAISSVGEPAYVHDSILKGHTKDNRKAIILILFEDLDRRPVSIL